MISHIEAIFGERDSVILFIVLFGICSTCRCTVHRESISSDHSLLQLIPDHFSEHFLQRCSKPPLKFPL